MAVGQQSGGRLFWNFLCVQNVSSAGRILSMNHTAPNMRSRASFPQTASQSRRNRSTTSSRSTKLALEPPTPLADANSDTASNGSSMLPNAASIRLRARSRPSSSISTWATLCKPNSTACFTLRCTRPHGHHTADYGTARLKSACGLGVTSSFPRLQRDRASPAN